MRAFMISLVIGLALSFTFVSQKAYSAIIPGQPCSQSEFGASKMDDNKQNIVACICVNATCNPAIPGSLQWKAMTQNNKNCATGQVVTGIAADGSLICGVTVAHACTTGQVVSGINADGSLSCVANGSSGGGGGGGGGGHACPNDTAGIALCGSRDTCRGQFTTATTCNSCVKCGFYGQDVCDVALACP